MFVDTPFGAYICIFNSHSFFFRSNWTHFQFHSLDILTLKVLWIVQEVDWSWTTSTHKTITIKSNSFWSQCARFQRGFFSLAQKRKQLEHVVTVATFPSFTTHPHRTHVFHIKPMNNVITLGSVAGLQMKRTLMFTLTEGTRKALQST